MTIPIIVKTAFNPMPFIKSIGAKAIPRIEKAFSKAAPVVFKSPYTIGNAAGYTGKFLMNPHVGMPLAGAGVGTVRSFGQQSKAIKEGRQEGFSWGQVGDSAARGATIGLGASFVKPLNKAWKAGFSVKGLNATEAEALIAKNPLWAKQRITPPKLLSKNYFKSIAEDMRHPMQSIKALGTDVRYGSRVVKDGQILLHRRSPVGMATMGAFSIGMPAKYLYDTANDKDAKPLERAVRMGSIGLSYTTPKMLPSTLMWGAPGMIFKKKKPPVGQAPDEQASQNI